MITLLVFVVAVAVVVDVVSKECSLDRVDHVIQSHLEPAPVSVLLFNLAHLLLAHQP